MQPTARATPIWRSTAIARRGAIRSKGFKRWLARRFFEATGGAPNSEALQSALNVIEAKAHFDGPERAVYIRVASDGRAALSRSRR